MNTSLELFYPTGLFSAFIFFGDLIGIVVLGAFIAKKTNLWLQVPMTIFASFVWVIGWELICLHVFTSEELWKFVWSH